MDTSRYCMTTQPPVRGNRPYLTIAASIVVAAVVIAASILALGYFGTATTVTRLTTITKTVASTPTTVQSANASCLKQIPQNASVSNYYNSTSQGYVVSYPNGTESYFPLDSCPVPVSPENYQVDSIIESNLKFIAAENGFPYVASNPFEYTPGVGSISNSTGEYTVFNFGLYSSQRIFPCGNSYWTYYELGLILVTIPLNSTGSLQFSHAQIQAEPGNNSYSCSTTQGS